jgi:hypothetical protein
MRDPFRFGSSELHLETPRAYCGDIWRQAFNESHSPKFTTAASIRFDSPNPNPWLHSRTQQPAAIVCRNPSAKPFDETKSQPHATASGILTSEGKLAEIYR